MFNNCSPHAQRPQLTSDTRRAGQMEEHMMTPQPAGTSNARSLGQRRRRERERALRGSVQLTTPPSTQSEPSQLNGTQILILFVLTV